MKVQLISDTHSKHKEVNIDTSVDMIVHAGDSTNYYDPLRNNSEFVDFIHWYGSLPIKHKLLIAGNHDAWGNRFYNRNICLSKGITYLEDSYMEIEGKLIFGSPWSPTFGNWYFMKSREKLGTFWDNILQEGIDLLITHTPPKGILDLTYDFDNSIKMCGCNGLLKAVNKYKPKHHVFGHCVDSKTEILTFDGWKNYNEINVLDNIYTYNLQTKKIEKDTIKEIIINEKYQGNVIYCDNSNHSFRVTDEHIVINLDHKNRLQKIKAKNIGCALRYPVSGYLENNKGILLNKNEIKLAVLIAADGSLEYENTKYVRFHLKKEYKIKYLEKILKNLNIKYNKKSTKIGTFKISFNLKDKYSILYSKPLLKELENVNAKQFKYVLEAYENSDGTKITENYIEIYTAKEIEANMIQKMCVLNGYKCIKEKTSNKLAYRMLCSKRQFYRVPKFLNKKQNIISESVIDELFWCVKTNNQTFITRRNGRVMITGNCHDNKNLINHGTRVVNGINFYNASCVKDGEFHKPLNNPNGIIINI